MGKVTGFYDCRILRGGRLIKEDLWVRNDKVIDPNTVAYKADNFVDCRGCIIAPGFIDIKLNGCLGVSFSNPDVLTEENITKVRAYLPHTGVTMFCPTIISSQTEVYPRALAALQRCDPTWQKGAGIAGVHLDGPFLTVPGAHDPKLMEKLGTEDEREALRRIESVYGSDLDNVAIVTLAPDLKGVLPVIRALSRWNIKVSLGHSRADIRQSEAAVKEGANLISHIFNAMPSFHHRDPGLVGVIASDVWDSSSMKFTIIADHYHVHKAALRMAYRMSPESLVLITDGTAPLGLPPARYTIDGIEVEVEEHDGKSTCKRTESGVLFGSVCPLHRAVKNLYQTAQTSLAYALESASAKPAQALGLYPRKGCLDVGSDADFIILTPANLDLVATFIAGKKVVDNQIIDLDHIPLALQEKPDFYAPRRQSLEIAVRRFNQSPSP